MSESIISKFFLGILGLYVSTHEVTPDGWQIKTSTLVADETER